MISLGGATLAQLAERHGGEVRFARREGASHESRGEAELTRIVPLELAGEGELAPLLSGRYLRAALSALDRGAHLLVELPLAAKLPAGAPLWVHPHAAWALAELLDQCVAPAPAAQWGEGCTIGQHVVLAPRVVIGARVRIGAGSVIGQPGFGWATSPEGALRAVPQLGGVIVEDDVSIGALCTIDAGTLGPTILRRGVKLDSQCHVGHNCVLGEGTIVAAQSGFAGSVRVGERVRIGGQSGIADHVTIGDGAQIAAKSGVIGDVPGGAVVAGYPAVSRAHWLRALARLYRGIRK